MPAYAIYRKSSSNLLVNRERKQKIRKIRAIIVELELKNIFKHLKTPFKGFVCS